MAKNKKFGTFSGVFTPSILTILGVIMYLRFPSIIGQAGLINTIGIIVIAHIISITTSLSVASLSTDKTVKTGGTYFMISRSLGLPIGGTLGLALFVGLSFSVSLYLIGFAESFLAYFDFDTSINSIRITGTLILVIVTTITLISTSLAIKSQYFIMVAIVLSLLSIFFGNHDFAPKEIHLQPMIDAAPFMLLFGIFFPAVTGFEAGVSMSGDLRDPKKSLPLGAIAAVGVGFVVYIGLALFYAFTVDAEMLMNDKDILFKISLVPVLVIVGIWGATLSSAFGSILGAPRILQAIAMDKIAPKFFAKGTGKTNEPRNALLLAFIIAEGGILIGELDVIARIVSMFFITTYAFLNLASAIESWSSSDFRPAFKIPKFVSVLGAASAFIVMILLDFTALAGAVLVLGLLFFFLRRKELVLESGDAWSSFWTNLAKKSLLKLNNQKTEQRNWRPNIVLFSGGEYARPHLVELGLALSGKLGALTDFELLIQAHSNTSVKTINNPAKADDDINYFKRSFICESVEAGIKAVTSIYGFSGFEPNTIMLGWSRSHKNSDFLAHILTDLKKKRLNAVFLDYDKTSGFGKKESIDIWWNGKGRNLSFALNLMRFLLADPDWRDAHLRILIINHDNNLTDRLYRDTKIMLDERRIDAEVKIIGDEYGNRTKEMIINSESVQADLIVLGISNNIKSYEKAYIENISQISDLPASLMILSPSDEFEEINLFDSMVSKKLTEKEEVLFKELHPLPKIENKVLNIRIKKLDEDLLQIANVFSDRVIKDACLFQIGFIEILKDFVIQNIRNLEKSLNDQSGILLSKAINKQHQIFLNFSVQFFDEKAPVTLLKTKDILSLGIQSFKSKVENFIRATPETIIIPLAGQPLEKEKFIYVKYNDLLSFHIYGYIQAEALEQLSAFEKGSMYIFSELKRVILQVNDIYEKCISNRGYEKEQLSQDLSQIKSVFSDLNVKLQNDIAQSASLLAITVREQTTSLASDLISPDAKKMIRNKIRTKIPQIGDQMVAFPEEWQSKVNLINQAADLDCHILSEQKIIHAILLKNNERIRNLVSEKVLKPYDLILINIDNTLLDPSYKLKEVWFKENIELKELFSEAYVKISEFLEKLPNEMEIAESNVEDSLIVKVAPQKIARYYMDTHLYEPFYRELEQLEVISRQAVIDGRESNTLMKFRLENEQNEEENLPFFQKSLKVFLQDLRKQIINTQVKLSEAVNSIQYHSDTMIRNAIAPLYSHAIIEAETEISSLLRGQKTKKISVGFFNRTSFIKDKFNSLLGDLLYSSSDGMILAKKFLNTKESKTTSVQQILDIAENQMPIKNILSQIPVFYRTLFDSSSLINEDFWVPMEKEITQIKEAIQRHKKGFGGAILIKGVHGSGKTTMSRYTVNRFFKKDRTYVIQPPLGGTCSLEDWHQMLAKVFKVDDYSSELFHVLPPESVVLINDLELWWERTTMGTKVIEEIAELINIHGKKVLFIINSNTFAFQHINLLVPLNELLISIVECMPFDARQLQQLIHNRHKTSGLTFYYQQTSEDDISQFKMATLFNQYFRYSEGVPGVAMNAWLANILKVDKQQIYIHKPELPDMDKLMQLNSDWLIVIALFVQHKLMCKHKLGRVMQINEEEADKVINHLLIANILLQKDKDIYMLNKYLEPFLINICSDKGII